MIEDTPAHATSALIASRAVALPTPDHVDFAQAFDRYADRRVVLLGEGSHGTHEFYAARAAITRRFVERHGFTIIAVEADWPDAATYNRYITGGPAPDASQPPFQRFPTWMWRNTVIRDLLRDLRTLNEGRPKERMAGFYGLDIYNMSDSIRAVLAYLDTHDPQSAQVARERYGCLAQWQADPATYGRIAMLTGFARCEEAVVKQCRDLLMQAFGEQEEAFDAAMNARLVASAEEYYRVMYHGGADSWNLRDSHMADTLEYLLDRAGPDAKALVWAHNSHIGDARATDMGRSRGEHNVGQLVRERWGRKAALIGFGTHTGTVTAASDWNGEREVKRVLPSRPDSHERLLHDTGLPRFLLHFGEDDALARAFTEPRLERYIGVIYRPETELWSHYSESMFADEYDAFVWFNETCALEPLASVAPHDAVPDTYPFGL